MAPIVLLALPPLYILPFALVAESTLLAGLMLGKILLNIALARTAVVAEGPGHQAAAEVPRSREQRHDGGTLGLAVLASFVAFALFLAVSPPGAW